PDPVTRQNMAFALARSGPKAKGAINLLIKHLYDEEDEVLVNVLLALGALGKDAKTALPYLEPLKLQYPHLKDNINRTISSIQKE
ncbi:MAG TPA: HEAT repeat domain-containing protein, partial [Bdellovibrionota bacterium]|nr:HEAT repeat domain-containing protein [Bdellovibrionota bacterium]